MLTAVMKKLGRQSADIAEGYRLLDSLRDAVGEAKARLAEIEAAPVPANEATEALGAWLDGFTTDAVDRLNLSYMLEAGRAAKGIRLPFPSRPVEGGVVIDATGAVEMMFGLFLATNREAVLELLGGQLADLADGCEAIPAAEREKRIAEAREALLEAELAEESCVRALESAGLQVSRRADADPAAVLAHDASLPG